MQTHQQDKPGMTRRDALARFAALSMAGMFGSAVPAWAGPEPSSEFTAAHWQTFTALCETYSELPQKLGIAKQSDLPGELRRRSDKRGPEFTKWATLILETLERSPQNSTFSDLSVTQRRNMLRKWWEAQDPSFDHWMTPRRADPKQETLMSDSIVRMAAECAKTRDRLPADQHAIDPKTLVVRYQPPAPAPADAAFPPVVGGPLDTEVQRLKYLRGCAFSLILSLHDGSLKGFPDLVV